jgi:SAM-dependent methyltransferase
MPFRERFDCLWCGTAWTTRTPSDLEGWSQLCPTCLGKAGANPFLRARLREALAARSAAGSPAGPAAPAAASPIAPSSPGAAPPAPAAPPRRATPASPVNPALPDDWFLRRGAFEQGAIHDAAWNAEFDALTRWVDEQPLAGRILEPAAGVGFFSPLIAGRGELHASDADGDALDRARDRLVAHRLRAHLHVRDPWARPADGEPSFDAALVSFLAGRVRGAGLDTALQLLRDRLRPDAHLALVDLLPDAHGGPPIGWAWTYHDPGVLEAALHRAGFAGARVTTTGRFFVLASATAA